MCHWGRLGFPCLRSEAKPWDMQTLGALRALCREEREIGALRATNAGLCPRFFSDGRSRTSPDKGKHVSPWARPGRERGPQRWCKQGIGSSHCRTYTKRHTRSLPGTRSRAKAAGKSKRRGTSSQPELCPFFKPEPLVTVPGPTCAGNRSKIDQKSNRGVSFLI
jgi:hypothetical protein